MHILNIVPSLNAVTGGPAFSSLNIGRAIAAAGHRVTLFTTAWPGSGPLRQSRAPDEGMRVECFPAHSLGRLIPLPCSPAMLHEVKRRCRDFDRILCHSVWNPIATFAMATLRRLGVPYLLMPHGMLDPVVFARHARLKRLAARVWERANVEGASGVLFNSTSERERALACGWSLREPMVFPHSIDPDYWSELPPRSAFESRFPQVKGREVVLFVGRIDWVKNLRLLIEALAVVRASRPSAMLVCVGPDSRGHRRSLERLARSLGLGAHVLFTGMQSGADLKAAYARGDVFALVSRKENFGIAAAEALACGLPAVLSDGVGLECDCPDDGPVRRTAPAPRAIAGEVLRLLERSALRGVPDPEARSLARAQFGPRPLPHPFSVPSQPRL